MLNTGILKELKLLRGNYKMYEPKNKIYVIKDKSGEVKKIIGKKEDMLAMRGLAMLTMKAPTPLEIQESIKRICNPDCKSEYLGDNKYKVSNGGKTWTAEINSISSLINKYGDKE